MAAPAMYALLADLVVYAHLLYVLFAVGGELLVLLGWTLGVRRGRCRGLSFTRRRGFRFAHLGAVALVAMEAVAGVLCPLTEWEYALRRLAGQRVESEIPFMARAVRQLIFYEFPPWVFTVAYVLFALLVGATLLLYPPRRRPAAKAGSIGKRSVLLPAQRDGRKVKHEGGALDGGTEAVKPAGIRLKTTLADGTRVLVRPLRPGDRAELQRGFGLLSMASRRFRFVSPMRRLTEPQLEQLTIVDQINHVALGVRDVGRRGGPGIAVARFVRLQPADPPEPVVAEFAVTVIDEYQGRGLGTLLVRLLLQAARSLGVEVLRGYVLEDNAVMLRVLQRFVTETRRDSGNVLRVDLPVGRNPEAGAAAGPSAASDGGPAGLAP
jgi:RimJ/RimL family protein N-acetyltransferase